MTSQSVIHPVILCGGSGTRLWPLSRQQFPKQFVPLIQGKSLLRLTAERLKPLLRASVTNPIISPEIKPEIGHIIVSNLFTFCL